jgi:hypothetical protein
MFEYYLHAASTTNTPVRTGSAGERRSHTFRVEHGVIIPQSSRCLIFWMCMSRNHANGETAVLVRALEAVVKPELAAAGRCLKRLPLSDSS